MAKISYPQLVHNIKEKYIEATGEPDNVKFGEIAQDIYDAIASSGGGMSMEVDILSSLIFNIGERV